MIVFKVGSALYEFDGILSVQTQEKYKFEKKSPFDPALNYRFGRYYQDSLDISIIAGAEQYEQLYYAIISQLSGNNPFIVSWTSKTGYQYRFIKTILPYPSDIMYLKNEISLKLESEPYYEIVQNMPNVTLNTVFNESIIDNTIWN